jgi:hypothetical protein
MSLRPLLLVAAALSPLNAQTWTAPVAMPASAGILGEHELQEIEQMPPQKQAERLLERAISRYTGALDQIDHRLPSWTGKLTYSKQFESLINVAHNSSELRVRTAAVELSLIAYKVAKEPAEARMFIDRVRSTPQDRPWRLWVVGLLANRGVEPEESRRLLLEFLHDPNEDTRQWAVNALSMLGTDDIIDPLLEVFGRDPSMAVRERAGCGLAEGGMMTREQRRKAIPGLIQLMDDPTLNETTRAWVFQALTEITGQHLGVDRAAWRDWHARHL